MYKFVPLRAGVNAKPGTAVVKVILKPLRVGCRVYPGLQGGQQANGAKQNAKQNRKPFVQFLL